MFKTSIFPHTYNLHHIPTIFDLCLFLRLMKGGVIRPFFMETEIKVHIVIYDCYGDFTAHTPDFPGLIATGNSKQEVVQKITRMLYRLALVEREKYKFQEN